MYDLMRNEHMTRIKNQAHRCAGSCSPRVGKHNVVMDETLKARLAKVVEALKGGIAHAACVRSLVWNRRKRLPSLSNKRLIDELR